MIVLMPFMACDYFSTYLDGATLDSLPVVFPPAEELEGSTEEEDGSTDLSTVNSVECVRMTFPGISLSI